MWNGLRSLDASGFLRGGHKNVQQVAGIGLVSFEIKFQHCGEEQHMKNLIPQIVTCSVSHFIYVPNLLGIFNRIVIYN